MLLPIDMKPENSVYYNASIITKQLQDGALHIIDLYKEIKEVKKTISLKIFIVCLDWLYLIDIIKIDNEGMVILCSYGS